MKEYKQRIKKLEEDNKQLKQNQNEEDPSSIQDLKTIIQDLLKEVKSQVGDLSEEEEGYLHRYQKSNETRSR